MGHIKVDRYFFILKTASVLRNNLKNDDVSTQLISYSTFVPSNAFFHGLIRALKKEYDETLKEVTSSCLSFLDLILSDET